MDRIGRLSEEKGNSGPYPHGQSAPVSLSYQRDFAHEYTNGLPTSVTLSMQRDAEYTYPMRDDLNSMRRDKIESGQHAPQRRGVCADQDEAGGERLKLAMERALSELKLAVSQVSSRVACNEDSGARSDDDENDDLESGLGFSGGGNERSAGEGHHAHVEKDGNSHCEARRFGKGEIHGGKGDQRRCTAGEDGKLEFYEKHDVQRQRDARGDDAQNLKSNGSRRDSRNSTSTSNQHVSLYTDSKHRPGYAVNGLGGYADSTRPPGGHAKDLSFGSGKDFEGYADNDSLASSSPEILDPWKAREIASRAMPASASQRDDSFQKSASNARPNGTNVRRSLITPEGMISPKHGGGGGGQYGVLIESVDAGTTNQLAALLRQSAALLEGASAPAAHSQGHTHPHAPSTSTRSPGGSPDGPRRHPPADYPVPRHQILTRSSHRLSPGASPSPPQSTSSQHTGSPSAEDSMPPDSTNARAMYALSRENLETHEHTSNHLTHSSYRGTEMPEDKRASPQRRPPNADSQEIRGRQDMYRQPSYGLPAGCTSDGDSPSRLTYPRPGVSQIDWRSGYDEVRLYEEQEQTSPISRSLKRNDRDGTKETIRKERQRTSPNARSLRQGGSRGGREAIESAKVQSGSNANPSAEISRRGDTTRTRSDGKSDRKSPLPKSPLSESDSRKSTKLFQEHFPEHVADEHGRRSLEEGIDDSGAGGLEEEGGWSDADGALAAHEMLRERYALAHRHRDQEFWDDTGVRERCESTRREEAKQDCEDFVDVEICAQGYLSHQRRGVEDDSMHARHDDASERGQRQYCDDVQDEGLHGHDVPETTDSAGDMLSEDALCHYKSLWVDVGVMPSSTPHLQSANANSSSPNSASSDPQSPCRPRSAHERSQRGGSETVWRGNPPLGAKSEAMNSVTAQGTSLSVLARRASLTSSGMLEGAKLPLSSAARLSPPPSQGLPRSTAPRVTSNPDSVKSPKAVLRLSSGAAKSHTAADRDSSLSPKSPASASRFTSSFSQKRSLTGDPRIAGSPFSSGRSPPGLTRIAASLSARVPARSPTQESSANMSSNRTSPKLHSTSRKSPAHSSFSHRITSSELRSATNRSADNHMSFSTRTTARSPPKSAQLSSVNNRTAVSLRARPWASSSNL